MKNHLLSISIPCSGAEYNKKRDFKGETLMKKTVRKVELCKQSLNISGEIKLIISASGVRQIRRFRPSDK